MAEGYSRSAKRIARSALAVLLVATVLLPALLFLYSCAAKETLSFEPQTITKQNKDTPLESIENPDGEMRGVYIATVANINYPSKSGLLESALKKELDTIVEKCGEIGFTAIYFQVRPTSDALYDSDIFPTSQYLSGKQGVAADGDFDPLEYLVEKAHAADIRVHAWVNPLRVTSGSTEKPNTDRSALSLDNPAAIHPDWVVEYGGALYYDAGIPEVRALVASGVAEIAANYDVDGVMFDDYFYPYPISGESFGDATTYDRFGRGIGIDNFRRESVNAMMKSCYDAIKSADPGCRFGVAPFGIWQNDNGENGGSATRGMSSYSAIYADTLAWIDGGYIDYVAPQVYWKFDNDAAAFDELVSWWNAKTDGKNVSLYISQAAYHAADGDGWGEEIYKQVSFARSALNFRGSIMYGWSAIMKNSDSVCDKISALYSESFPCSGAIANGSPLEFVTPQSGSTVAGEYYSVIGRSDPIKVLYLDGQPVSRTKSGYFSLYLPLNKGNNNFKFTYGGEDVTYTLTRDDNAGAAAGGTVTMPEYAITSLTPSARSTVRSGGTLTVKCKAPAGSTVTATLGNLSVTLKAQNYPDGAASLTEETYIGSFALPDNGGGEITSLGAITVTASSRRGNATAQGGEVRVLPTGGGLSLEVINDGAALKDAPDSEIYDDFTAQAAGMRAAATEEYNGYYHLSSGGYVSNADAVEIDEEAPGVAEVDGFMLSLFNIRYSAVSMRCSERAPVTVALDGDTVTITVHNAKASSTRAVIYDNPVFKTAEMQDNDDGRVTVTLTLKNSDNYFGSDVSYIASDDTNGLLVTFRSARKVALDKNKNSSLVGKTILLDAGHGGEDGGASGAGEMLEKDINLAIVKYTAETLEKLGATVVLTRTDDSTLSLDERKRIMLDTNPDIAISVHQNSVDYSADITAIRGTLGLWWSHAGRLLADTVSATVAEKLGTVKRDTARQKLVVASVDGFPCALIETSFMSCVEEYEYLTTQVGQRHAAAAIADGIIAYYNAQAAWVMTGE